MSPEREILDYLAGEDETLERLLLACPDLGRLIGCLAHMYDEGRVWIRLADPAGPRPVRAFEVQAWRSAPPEAEVRTRILVGLTDEGLRRG